MIKKTGFAIEDMVGMLRNLVLNEPITSSDELRYICALLSELAYYHIPQFELDEDNRKRAILVPCDEFQRLVDLGIGFNLEEIAEHLRELANRREIHELVVETFVVETKMVVALVVRWNEMLFISFRGTILSFGNDLITDAKFLQRDGVHRGFAESAIEISSLLQDRINEEFSDKQTVIFKHVFFTGHSLGAAVAAISEQYLQFNQNYRRSIGLPTEAISEQEWWHINHHSEPKRHCIIFGSPRYRANYDNLAMILSPYITLDPPTTFRRDGDLVPTIPPKLSHYYSDPDPTDVFDSNHGALYTDYTGESFVIKKVADWVIFLITLAGPHKIANYRKDLGSTIKAPHSQEKQLVDLRKLKRRDLK